MAIEIIDVNTGQVDLVKDKGILRSVALGSCIAVVAYDAQNKIGAVAHIMLPGIAPANSRQKDRYASNAISHLLNIMSLKGAKKYNIRACIVGAGNVLKKEGDTICRANIESVKNLLAEHRIPINASSVGGTERRSIFLDVDAGNIYYTKGDSSKMLLWTVNDETLEMGEKNAVSI